MSRGGRLKTREVSERRCVATGESAPKFGLIRFVVGPEDVVVPDLAEKLPGRGVWVSAQRAALEKAVTRKLFSRGAKRAVSAPEDLVDQVEKLLVQRAIASISLSRKAGMAVCGFEKTRAALLEGKSEGGALLQAQDGAAHGRNKIRRVGMDLPEITCLTSAELGLAFGRSVVIHALLTPSGATDRVIRDCDRLLGFRGGETADQPLGQARQAKRAQ